MAWLSFFRDDHIKYAVCEYEMDGHEVEMVPKRVFLMHWLMRKIAGSLEDSDHILTLVIVLAS